MKKVLSIIAVLVLCISIVACSGTNKVEQYINDHKTELITSFESSFEGSGATCETDISAQGNVMVIDIRVNEFDNLDDATKTLLQQTYDSMSSVFDSALAEMRKELPELEGLKINVCEKDGDVAAVINCK